MVLTWVKRVCMLWIFSSLSKVLKLVNSRLEQAAHRVWAWGVSSFCLSKLWRKKYIKLWDRWDEMRWDVLVNILRATSLWPGISGPGMWQPAGSQLCCWAGRDELPSMQIRRRKRGEPGNPLGISEITTDSICSHLGKDKLLFLPWWISAEHKFCKWTSSLSLIKWWLGYWTWWLSQLSFSLGLWGRAGVLAVLGNNDLIQEHPI